MDAMIASITAGVNFASVITGLGVIFLAVAGVYIAMRGGKMIINAVKG